MTLIPSVPSGMKILAREGSFYLTVVLNCCFISFDPERRSKKNKQGDEKSVSFCLLCVFEKGYWGGTNKRRREKEKGKGKGRTFFLMPRQQLPVSIVALRKGKSRDLASERFLGCVWMGAGEGLRGQGEGDEKKGEGRVKKRFIKNLLLYSSQKEK